MKHKKLMRDTETFVGTAKKCNSPLICDKRSEKKNPVIKFLQNVQPTYPILDFSATAEQGVRRTMEDQYVMLGDGIPFFAIYDGHGGTQCAEYLRDHLHKLILGHPEIMSSPEKAICEGITKADQQFLQRCKEENIESGSVCVVALFINGDLVVGNVGDCEAVLCRRGSLRILTKVHNPNRNAAELERVASAGGRLFNKRLGHPKFNPRLCSLAVSRALGDAGFKFDDYTGGMPSGLISDADTFRVTLEPEDDFLLIGSDGLWDVMSYEEATECCYELLKRGKSPKCITDTLVSRALSKGTTDNVIVVFVRCSLTPSSTIPDYLTHSSIKNRII
ncbi:unnamed protein product [Phytomonas sp. EM1]|nr:unnamed protein product [Phytomonas sp. EM1]|eukprot:CCW60655.1 unnamed protein product [Phytomonas sp. isolate EM1]